MKRTAGMAQALPFFLPVRGGELFCHCYQPPADVALRGAVFYVAPFADEMNKCRRAASQQAHAFAAHGYAVLQMDLWGCGDSSGDFSSANWQRWLEDMAVGWSWLVRHATGPCYLWCVRLGALLGLQFSLAATPAVAGAVLWQPELNGRDYLLSMRRMQRLGNMLASDRQPYSDPDEIGGYQLAPELISTLEQACWTDAPVFPVCCIEFSADAGSGLASSRTRSLTDNWRRQGAQASYVHIDSAPFWSANEILQIPQAIPCSIEALRAMQK